MLGHPIKEWGPVLRVQCTCRPQPKYAPWFGVVLQCARLAVKVLGALSEEVAAPGPTCNRLPHRAPAAW